MEWSARSLISTAQYSVHQLSLRHEASHLRISPLEGEMSGRTEGGVFRADIREFIRHLPISHTSPFTRAVPPRGLTMHVSRSLRFHGGSAGARNRATLVMTASRQPVRPVSAPRSVVFPAQLRSLCVTECLGVTDASPSLHAHDVPPAIHRWHVGGAGPSPPAGIRMPPMPHRHAGAFSAPRRTIFCAGHDSEVYVLPLHHQHRSHLDASPCVVAVAERKRLSHGFSGRG